MSEFFSRRDADSSDKFKMDIVILGAGGHGKVVLDILRVADQHRIVGFIDADPSLAGSEVVGVKVLGGVNILPRLRQQKIRGVIVAVGDNRVRASYAQLAMDAKLDLINAIHPAASVSPSAKLGNNVVVAAGAMICADAELGDSVVANTGCVIDHECVIGAASHICPGALLAGRVRVGSSAFIGLGAKILPCLNVGDGAIVGAGATVTTDVLPGAIVIGTPARNMNRKAA